MRSKRTCVRKHVKRKKPNKMDMQIFQVKTNQTEPIREGSILIASPLLNDYHFVRSVVMIVSNEAEGSMGIVMNKRFKGPLTLNQLIPELKEADEIPVFLGGPLERDTLFFIHRFRELEGAFPLGNGLYLNGDFEYIKNYIASGMPVEGRIRFFTGYSGWGPGQLQQELDNQAWIVGKSHPANFLQGVYTHYWTHCMNDLGGLYRFWAKYPVIPSLN